MSLEHCNDVSSGQVYFGLNLNVARNEAWVVSEALCSLRWRVGLYSIFKETCIINFFSPLLFKLLF